MNNIILIGNIVRPLDLKQSQGGKSYLNNCIAVTRTLPDANGSKITDFINFTVFGGSANYLANYGAKGAKVCICGRLEINEFTAKDGTKKRDAVVMVERAELMEFKQEREETPAQAYQAQQPQQVIKEYDLPEAPSEYDIADEDLPF